MRTDGRKVTCYVLFKNKQVNLTIVSKVSSSERVFCTPVAMLISRPISLEIFKILRYVFFLIYF